MFTNSNITTVNIYIYSLGMLFIGLQRKVNSYSRTFKKHQLSWLKDVQVLDYIRSYHQRIVWEAIEI